MFRIDDDQTKQLESDLKQFAERAFPFATKATVNKAAFTARRFAQENVRQQMVERNRFTAQSIRVKQATTLNVRRQAASVGSIADYMADQEFGAVKTRRGKEGVPLPTTAHTGEGRNVRPRRKAINVNARKHISKMRLNKSRRQPKNNKQALLFKVQDAVTTGRRLFYHDFGQGKKKGIFRVKGGSRRFRRGWPVGAEIDMVYDLSETSITIPKNAWLRPASLRTERKLPELYREALEFQLKRRGLLGR